jgi:hypothetical protein
MAAEYHSEDMAAEYHSEAQQSDGYEKWRSFITLSGRDSKGRALDRHRCEPNQLARAIGVLETESIRTVAKPS